MKKMIWLLSLSLFFVGCVQTPTKVYQSSTVQNKDQSEILITDQTVIVDARPAFDYSLAHLSGAINLRPEDFNQKEKPFLGLLDKDLYFFTRKLARMGISEKTPVVVVGRGTKGIGEEGRVAWTLRYLGVKDVRFASIEAFKLPLINAETEPRQPAPLWKPNLDESLLVNRKDFVRKSMKVHPDFIVMDVRAASEYLGKVKGPDISSTPDVGAINIPWTEFFDERGMVEVTVKQKLQAIGISIDKKIYVIGRQGIESAAVTLALRELGYSQAANYAGGYLELTTLRKSL